MKVKWTKETFNERNCLDSLGQFHYYQSVRGEKMKDKGWIFHERRIGDQERP
jgi:hypothetical protein